MLLTPVHFEQTLRANPTAQGISVPTTRVVITVSGKQIPMDHPRVGVRAHAVNLLMRHIIIILCGHRAL